LFLRKGGSSEHWVPRAVLHWLPEALSEGRLSQNTNAHRVVIQYSRTSTTGPLSTFTAVENSCILKKGF